MHAREWATPAAGQYAVLQFLEGYTQNNKEMKELLTKVNIYYCPFVNPVFIFSIYLRMVSNSLKETECGERTDEEATALISIEIGLLDLEEVEAQV
jgi:hypothetical protein